MRAPTARPSLARATGVMAAGTALSRLTGFGRNIALAIFVGQNLLSDTYNLANVTPNIVYELLLGGVLSATLVPLFVQQLHKVDGGSEEEATAAWHDLSSVVTLAVVASVAATVALVLAAPLVVGLYFGKATADQRAIGTGLVRLFALQVAAYGVIALSTALLTARRRFAAPMFAPVANNLVVIATIALLPRVAGSLEVGAFRSDGRAIAFLGLGTTLGVMAMAAVQVARLPAAGLLVRRPGRTAPTERDHLQPRGPRERGARDPSSPPVPEADDLGSLPGRGAPDRVSPPERVAPDPGGPPSRGSPRAARRPGLRPTWDTRAPSIRRLVALSGWTVGLVVANQLALLVVSRLAIERRGEYSAYTLALIFFLLPHGVYAVSVITALQPDMAERWAADDRAGLAERVVTGLRTILAVIVPAAVGLALVSSPLVRTLLLHGRFDERAAEVTAGTLACLALGLPGFSGFLFLTRVWQSMQNTRMTFLLYLLENGVNIVLAIALFPRFGARGLAAAYGAAYTVAALAALAVLSRRLPTGWSHGIGPSQSSPAGPLEPSTPRPAGTPEPTTAGPLEPPTPRSAGPLGPYAARLAVATGVLAIAVGAGLAAVGAALPPGSTRAAVQLAVAVPLGAAGFLTAAVVVGLREPLDLVRPLVRRVRRRPASRP